MEELGIRMLIGLAAILGGTVGASLALLAIGLVIAAGRDNKE